MNKLKNYNSFLILEKFDDNIIAELKFCPSKWFFEKFGFKKSEL